MKYLVLIVPLLLGSCGKFEVDHDVSGTVTVQVTLPVEAYEPFFLIDCGTRVSGQPCYDPDPPVCATCMANALTKTLGGQ